MIQKPALYGIKNSNRNFADPYNWGKNQFNSSFPASLVAYMRDSDIKPIYITLDNSLKTNISEISVNDLFQTDTSNEELYFAFESRFEPHKELSHDEIEKIDLVIKDLSGTNIVPLEIKLTTIPDNTTADKNEDEYGAELVIRSATMRYMALGMASTLRDKFGEIMEIFAPALHGLRGGDWESKLIKNRQSEILDALELFFKTFYNSQKPLLMQPIWKTLGKSSLLADNCLDVFVWSDFAISRLFMDSAKSSSSKEITRQQRAAFRMARFLFEIARDGKIYQQPIYDGMTYDTQNDKEFAVSGNITNKFMKCDRLKKPIIHKNQIKEIVLGGGQKYLSPERRFDAILYFSSDLFNT